MKAVRVHAYGGPDVLRLDDAEVPVPGPGEALVRIAAAGLNFIDVSYRTGLFKAQQLPFVNGSEAAGIVEAVGSGVRDVAPGDRVAYCMVLGAYAEFAVVPSWRLVPVPADIDLATAAAAMLQGSTAHYLTRSTFALKPGDVALVHAAAGGAGYLLTQAARACGATVIATVGSEAKAAVAREAGAHEVIDYSRQDFETEVMRLTEGRGVDVVYDSVGAATFDKGLNCLRARGLMVLFGMSSGPVPPVDPAVLGVKGSLFLTRPGLNKYTATREEVLGRAADVFAWIRDGAMKLRIHATVPLAEAAAAHRDLEGRKTTGKVLFDTRSA